ncbi:phosphoribosylamine--glycine ligase [Roseomonas sp. PWR1]|uniref:Phosphoribosylamine--glycine ligase n=1 Tax=Roseomonas nitratireducens TaxID=2820810 RepID=A0ABS4AZL7_9PROT|nr:phosphoribosylamine--glycine ligase [Neoroseomonas nitratireducens]MBP0466789.1 phosphoribosylamine--glycine ligase [Neoroseomonas nitratireducens]
MTVRAFALAALLGLAACGGGVVGRNLPNEPGPDAEACRREALNDPEARRIASSSVAGNLSQEDRVRRELAEALPRIYYACMRRRGAPAAGGVERVRSSSGW